MRKHYIIRVIYLYTEIYCSSYETYENLRKLTVVHTKTTAYAYETTAYAYETYMDLHEFSLFIPYAYHFMV